jgi:hypothetical protein
MPSPVTSITFNDGVARTLTNGKPYPANRFDNWTMAPIFRGTVAHRQSDLTPTAFSTARLSSCSFQLSKIPSRTTSALRYLTVAHRLIAHLLNAGSCVVNTGDTDTTTHSGLYLLPGFEPTITLTDPGQLEYTLSLALFDPAGTILVCNYDP